MIDDSRPQLEMRWLPVAGVDGRTRMEAVWITAEAVAAPAQTVHAA